MGEGCLLAISWLERYSSATVRARHSPRDFSPRSIKAEPIPGTSPRFLAYDIPFEVEPATGMIFPAEVDHG